jgi:hypothetical protein
MESVFLQGNGQGMGKAKEKFLSALSYCTIFTIALSSLSIAAMGGYLYGSSQTARAYDVVLEEFIDNVEARQVFFFRGYKVVPKEKIVAVKLRPHKLAEFAAARAEEPQKNTDDDDSKRSAGPGLSVRTSALSDVITRGASIPF